MILLYPIKFTDSLLKKLSFYLYVDQHISVSKNMIQISLFNDVFSNLDLATVSQQSSTSPMNTGKFSLITMFCINVINLCSSKFNK